MLNTLITHLQIFGIGFSLGIAGPCLLVCTPVILAYTAGTKRKYRDVLGDIFIFLAGRLAAYMALGYLAGMSGLLLRQFINPDFAVFLKPLAGIFSIILGFLIFIYKDTDPFACPGSHKKIYNFGGIFAFGFLIGITPCAPLTALLFEIILISKNGLEGASYAFSFGLGTFLASLLVLGALGSVFTWIPAKVLKSNISRMIFKTVCALFLISMGLYLVLL